MRVLVIDTSASIRRRLRERFAETAQIDVREAADGPRALDVCAALALDAVLLDIAIGPGSEASGDGSASPMSGLDLIPRLKSLAPRAPVIVLTNRSSDAHRRECLLRGAAHFFDKSREFERAIEVVLGCRS